MLFWVDFGAQSVPTVAIKLWRTDYRDPESQNDISPHHHRETGLDKAGFMDSFRLVQSLTICTLTRNKESSDQATFFSSVHLHDDGKPMSTTASELYLFWPRAGKLRQLWICYT